MTPPGGWSTSIRWAVSANLWNAFPGVALSDILGVIRDAGFIGIRITQFPGIVATYALIDRFPDLTLVIDHMADCPLDQPAEIEKLIALRRHPKVFVKISHTWWLSRQPYPYLMTSAGS